MIQLRRSRAGNVSVACFLVLLFTADFVFSASNIVIAENLVASPASALTITDVASAEHSFPIHHSLTKLPNGSICTIFLSRDIEPDIVNGVYVSLSSDNGVTWSTPHRVSTQQFCSQGYAIASDSQNNVYAAWIGNDGLASARVFFSKFDGVVWNLPVDVSVGIEPAIYCVSIDMCIDGNGNVHLVWDTSRSGNSTHDYMRNQIYYAKYDGEWSSPVLISNHFDSTPFFQLNPSIAVDSKNNLHVVWEGSNYLSTAGQVWYVKNDGYWHYPTQLAWSDIPSMFVMYVQAPVIAVDSNDLLHVAWQAAADSNVRTNQIWYLSYSNSTGPSIPRVISNVPLSSTSDQEWPTLSIDAANRVHVMWMSTREDALYYSRYDPLQSWSTPVQVEESNAIYPNLAASPLGSPETTELGYVFTSGSKILFNTVLVDSLPTGPAFSVAVSPVSEIIGVGQTLRLTCSVVAGIAPYSYQWCLNGSVISETNISSWLFTESSVGTYLVSVMVTDATGNVVYSQDAKVKVTNEYIKGHFGCIEKGNEASGQSGVFAFGTKYPLNVNATITSMSAYLTTWQGQQQPSSFNCRFAIYSDNNGYVGNLISQTKISTYNLTDGTRLCKATFDTPVTLSPGNYWLLGVSDAPGVMACNLQTNDYNQSIIFDMNDLNFPSTVSDTPFYGKIYSIYASWELNRPSYLQEVFSISSNSTVSSLVFDTERNQLFFTVSGPSGTVGYADLYISKSLLDDARLLTVFLDDARLNFTSTFQDDVWILHFVYSHSTHEITVNMENTVQETPTAPSVIPEIADLKILGLITVILTTATLTLLIVFRQGNSEGKNLS